MRVIQPVDEAFWWEVAAQCDYATFFHTPLWHKLAANTFADSRDVTIGVILDQGVRAVMPLLEKNRFGRLSGDFISSYASCYGGIIANGEVSFEDQQKIFKEIATAPLTSIQIVGNPLIPQTNPGKHFTPVEDFTHILTLDEPFETLFSNFSKGHRSSFNKGLRMNVSVRPAGTIEEYRDYYEAYEDSLQRWGDNVTSEYPWELLANGFQIAQDYPEQIKLWVAEVEGKIIAGAWVFYWNQHIVWWHGAAYANYFDHYPNNVLQTIIIRDALKKGYRYYDFNPSGGHAGVARFKKHFGAKEYVFKKWVFDSKGKQWARRIKKSFYHGK